jgi:tetratricopeptide (TPR) repeat protein
VQEVKTVKKVKKSNSLLNLLVFMVLISILPLYGLFFKKEAITSVVGEDSQSLVELKQAAQDLQRVGQFESAAELLWRYYQMNPSQNEKIQVLQQLETLYEKLGDVKRRLACLYVLSSLHDGVYDEDLKRKVHASLKSLGKDKDAALFLQASTSLDPQKNTRGSGNLVIAMVDGEEVYLHEVEKLLQGDKKNKEKILSEFLMRRVLKKESLSLLEDGEFKKNMALMAEEMRISEFLRRQIALQSISEFDLKNYYESHKEQWNHNKGFKLLHACFADKKEASSFAAAVSDKKSFMKLAGEKSISLDKVKGGEVKKWVEDDVLVGVGRLEGLYSFLQTQKEGKSELFSSRKGWHCFFIEQIREASFAKFEDVKSEVESEYRQKKQSLVRQGYLKKLFNKYKVVIQREAF